MSSSRELFKTSYRLLTPSVETSTACPVSRSGKQPVHLRHQRDEILDVVGVTAQDKKRQLISFQVLLVTDVPVQGHDNIEFVFGSGDQFTVISSLPALIRYCANHPIAPEMLAQLDRDVLVQEDGSHQARVAGSRASIPNSRRASNCSRSTVG